MTNDANDGRIAVTTSAAMPPAGPYSQAVRHGDLLFISGQGPFDEAGNVVGETFVEQLHATFRNLEAIAEAAGGSLSSVQRLGVYLRSLENFAALNDTMRDLFEAPYPARTTIPADLPGFEVEIDAIVVVPPQ